MDYQNVALSEKLNRDFSKKSEPKMCRKVFKKDLNSTKIDNKHNSDYKILNSSKRVAKVDEKIVLKLIF